MTPLRQTLVSAATAVPLALLLLAGCAKKEEQLRAYIQTSKGTIVVKLFEEQTPKTVDNFVGLAEGTKPFTPPDEEEAVTRPFYDGLTFHRVIEDFMIQGGCPIGDGTGGPGYRFEDECYRKGDPISGEIENAEQAEAVFDTLIQPYLAGLEGQAPSDEIARLTREIQFKRSPETLVGKTVEEIQAAVGSEEPVHERELIHPVAYGTLCMANSGPDTNGSQFFIVSKKGGAPWLDGKHTVFGEVVDGLDVLHAIETVETDARNKPLEPVTIQTIDIKRERVRVEDA